MASKENQEALDDLYDYAQMGCSTWDSEKDNKSINNSKQVIQKAIDDLELYKKAFMIATNGKQTNFLKNSNDENIEPYRNYLLEQARKELDYEQ